MQPGSNAPYFIHQSIGKVAIIGGHVNTVHSFLNHKYIHTHTHTVTQLHTLHTARAYDKGQNPVKIDKHPTKITNIWSNANVFSKMSDNCYHKPCTALYTQEICKPMPPEITNYVHALYNNFVTMHYQSKNPQINAHISGA